MSDKTPVPSGTKARYRKTGLSPDRLGGQVRIVGPRDMDGGAEMLDESGVACDYRDMYDLSSDVFWKTFEPYEAPPAPGSLFMDSERTSYRCIGLVNELTYYIRQTVSGQHDMTSRLPEDASYVFDAANPTESEETS